MNANTRASSPPIKKGDSNVSTDKHTCLLSPSIPTLPDVTVAYHRVPPFYSSPKSVLASSPASIGPKLTPCLATQEGAKPTSRLSLQE